MRRLQPNTTTFLRFTPFIFVSIFIIGCDQISKILARICLSHTQPIRFLGGILEFTFTQNAGSFLGLGAHMPPIARFLIFTIGITAFLFVGTYYLITKYHFSTPILIILALIVGGAISNQIDRILFHGLVTDFLYLSFGPIHTGIFNLADMSITFGSLYLLYASWRRPNQSFNPDATSASH